MTKERSKKPRHDQGEDYELAKQLIEASGDSIGAAAGAALGLIGLPAASAEFLSEGRLG